MSFSKLMRVFISNRVAAATFTLVAMGIIVAGCGTGEPEAAKVESYPYAGQEVELLVPKSLNLPALWEVQLQEWMTQTKATVRWNEYSAADEASLPKFMAEAVPAGGRLVLFPLAQLSELDRHLAPLDSGHAAGFDPKDLLKGLRDRVVTRDRSVVAIPTACPVLTCYYRADLLRGANRKRPETWEDYQALLNSLDQWAPNLNAVEPLDPSIRSSMFFARALACAKHPENYSVWFDLENGQPMIDSEGFVQATMLAQQAWKRMPATIAKMTPADCRREILEGRAALAIGVERISAASSGEVSRAAGIEIGVCQLPGSRRTYNRSAKRWDTTTTVHQPALCGFEGQALGLTLPKQGKDDVSASHLLSLLIGEKFESCWSSLPKTVCRESQVGYAAAWHEAGLTTEESSQQVDAVAQSLRSNQLVADFPISQAAEFRSATSAWIGQLLEQPDADPAMMIKQLQQEFDQIVTRIGPDVIRKEYRRGLGLASF